MTGPTRTGPTRPGDDLSDTQRRFLVAVMQRLPRHQVHEVYLFAPMKQGGVETGIAVVAIGEPSPADSTADTAVDTAADSTSPPPADERRDEQPPSDGTAVDAADAADAADEERELAAGAGCDPTEAAAGAPAELDITEADQSTADALDALDADAADAELPDALVEDVDADADAEAESEADTDVAVAPVAAHAARFTIFTARYRLQLKGPERGKWDVDVVEEADAPLVTVDAVVRGVHRRSGEPSEVERLAPQDLARALGEIPWTSES